MKSHNNQCDACGGTSVVPVIYGLPTEEAFESARRGEIALGGCIVDFDNPTLACTSCGWNNRYNFDHFIEAQSQKRDGLATALKQLSEGAKTSHWIWYIFPQIGLGTSPQARRFAINSAVNCVTKYGEIFNNTSNETQVETININSLISTIEEKINFLKVDCEGSEYDLFQTITSPNLQKIERCVIETHGEEIDNFVYKTLVENHFEVKKYKNILYAINKNW